MRRSDPKTGKINHPKVTTLWRCWKKRSLMDVAFFNCTHLWWACHLGNQQSAWPPNTHTSDHHHTAQICQPTRPHKHILVLRSWRGPFSVCVQTALNPNIVLNHNSNHHVLSHRYVFTRCSIVFPLCTVHVNLGSQYRLNLKMGMIHSISAEYWCNYLIMYSSNYTLLMRETATCFKASQLALSYNMKPIAQ